MAHTVEILTVAQRQFDKLAKKNARDTRAIYDAIFDLEPAAWERHRLKKSGSDAP